MFPRTENRKICQSEEGYSDGGATTKVDIITAPKTRSQRNAILADLNERFRVEKAREAFGHIS